MTRPPAHCHACQVNRVAWVTPRVDFCYDCLPGGPFSPPACRDCGSAEYFSDGRCASCHPGGPQYLDACRGCLAWGVYRQHSWLCWSCRWWRGHYPAGDCEYCGRSTTVGERGACRLCLEQARMLQEPGRALDLIGANQVGQQLFLANMAIQRRRKTPRLQPEPAPAVPVHEEFIAVPWRQLALLDLKADPDLVKARALQADSELLQHCKQVLVEHATQHGWSSKHRHDVVRSLRLLQVLQDSPGAKIKATDVLQLPRYGGNIISTLEVLAAAGLLIDDRPSRVETYFVSKTSRLPPEMTTQLEIWLNVMLNGSTSAPRQRSRDPMTVQIHIMGVAPIITAWADAGHRSLAEITPEQVRAALPERGSRRNWAEYGLRSLFTTLKARKLIFANPTRGMRSTPVNTSVPLPLDTAAIRQALNSTDPAVAFAVSLVAFHALTRKEIRDLELTDIVDGNLRIRGRVIPLAGPVRARLSAWLDHRARTWPNSVNPHLFISMKTAPRLMPVGDQFPWTKTNLRPQALREDRILQEIHATGGDVRRICDLFGIGIEAALRYGDTLQHADVPRSHDLVPRTRHPV